MMGRVSSISSGTTQTLPVLRRPRRPLHLKTASLSKPHLELLYGTSSWICFSLMLWICVLSGSAAAVPGQIKRRSSKCLVLWNPWLMMTMTQRLCMLLPVLWALSSRWETASTCLLTLLILGKQSGELGGGDPLRSVSLRM